LILTVFGSWILISQTSIAGVYPAYFLIHKLASELLLVHGTLYLAHNFNTLQAKRLFPLIFAGEQLGNIFGGLFVTSTASLISTDLLPLFWVALMVLSIMQIYLWHRRRGSSPYFTSAQRSGPRIKSSLKSVYQGLLFARRSSLLRNASLALFFLVIVYYILAYSTNRIFTEAYPDEQSLAGFLGLLTAITSGITLAIQILLTNRLIGRFGIRRMNYLFPAVTGVAASALLFSFTLPIAIMVSIGRDSLLNALQNPLKSIFMNALPAYIQGRARSVSIVLVMPVALLVCGAMLVYIQQLSDPLFFLIPAIISAVAFLYFSYRMNGSYVHALTVHLKEHLFIPGASTGNLKLDLDGNSYSALQTLFVKLPKARVQTLVLLARYFPSQSIDFILPRLSELTPSVIDKYLRTLFENTDRPVPYNVLSRIPFEDNHLHATVLKLLSDHNHPEAFTDALSNLTSTSPRVRAASSYVILNHHNADKEQAIKVWGGLLTGNYSEQMSSLDLLPLLDNLDQYQLEAVLPAIETLMTNMVNHQNPSVFARLLRQLPDYSNDHIRSVVQQCVDKLIKQTSPDLRAVAAHGLKMLPRKERDLITLQLLNDRHISLRASLIGTLKGIDGELEHMLTHYVFGNNCPPEPQSVLLDAANALELIPHSQLQELACNYANEACNYASALIILRQKDNLSQSERLLCDILLERKCQYMHLALQTLDPLCAHGQITAIQAALHSKYSRHIANACEILNNIENQPAVKLLIPLFQDALPNPELLTGIELNNCDNVLDWVTSRKDVWINQVATIHLEASVIEQESIELIERITLLKQTDIFSDVATEDLLFVAQELDEIQYFTGDRVFSINEPGEHLYIIINGRIGLSISPDPDSTDYIVVLGNGASFGEMNLLDDLPRSGTANVLEDTTLLALEKHKLHGLLRSYSELSMGMLRAMSLKVRENHERNLALKKELDKKC
jgi:hypothetical protein